MSIAPLVSFPNSDISHIVDVRSSTEMQRGAARSIVARMKAVEFAKDGIAGKIKGNSMTFQKFAANSDRTISVFIPKPDPRPTRAKGRVGRMDGTVLSDATPKTFTFSGCEFHKRKNRSTRDSVNERLFRGFSKNQSRIARSCPNGTSLNTKNGGFFK